MRRFGDSIRIQREYPYPVAAVWSALAQNPYSWFVGRTLRLGWADLLRRKLPATVAHRAASEA